MNLDSRIKDILYIADCFTTENYKQYVGTECYLTDEISRFSDLDKCTRATLAAIYEDNAIPMLQMNAVLSSVWHLYL